MRPAITRGRGSISTLAASLFLIASSLVSRPTAQAQTPSGHTVSWDSHSLLVDGQRVFLYSGEFHYWRLPSREQWLDRLQKMKAAGLNAVSIYFDWQYHSSAPGVYDFSGVRDVDYLLGLTERLGLYVIARVGPYMNAEVDAGGLPGWVLRQQLFPRSQSWNGSVAGPMYSALYSQYSKEWYDHLLPILARHQVTQGGSVLLLSIENEYSQTEGSEQYMHDLYGYARGDGITVPIFHNDFYFRGDWSKLVDVYAYDSYPYGFSCCHQWWDLHFHGIDSWESTLRNNLKITTPMFVSELQGGAFQPWGGKAYDKVAQTLDGDWLNAIDQSAFAQGATILNTYMFAGGTSWGYMSEPEVYTSYDYGAPISETGALRPAFYAAHRLGSFLQTYGPSLAAADVAPGLAHASNGAVVVHTRLNPQNNQAFIFLRHGDAGPAVQTSLQVNVGGASRVIPQQPDTSITVPGHGAELLTANVDVGPLHMNYSTSQVLTNAPTALGDYLVLFGPAGSSGETDFNLPTGAVSVVHDAGVKVARRNGELRLNYTHTADPRTIAVQTPNGTLRLLVVTADAASRTWAANGTVLVGPDLVTGQGKETRIWFRRSHGARVYGAGADQSLSLDGRITAAPDPVMGTTLLGLVGGAPAVGLPALQTWKFRAEAPEIDPGFDDSSWTPADHSATTNPNVPASSNLLADDYGFHYGYVWYRGHFTASGQETGIAIQARHSYAVYVNGAYVGGGDSSLDAPPHTYASPISYPLPAGLLHAGSDNVVAVLTESLGHDEGWVAGPAAQSPQGILAVGLEGAATPIAWKVQGNLGGEQPSDRERGLLNASGLYGERAGWYLPGYDDGGWQTVTAPDSWLMRGVAAPVGWYRTHFQLSLPAGAETPIRLLLPHVSDKATIWLNGWLIGRYWEQKGPQHAFYLPQGVLNPRGDNVLAIAVWNRGHDGGLTAVPALTQDASLAAHTVDNAATQGGSAAPDYWHTDRNRILDSRDRPVRIAAVNWFGMENTNFVPAGLDRQPLDQILSRVHDLGFNTVRLPFSNQAVEENPVVTDHLDANPELKGLHALDIMDRIVESAARHALRVILDDGRSSAGTQPERNGLWYTPRYPESAWISDWQSLIKRYLGNPTVVGVDLRNEPHTGPPGPWSVKTYLNQGATWGPYKGIEHEATDWRLGAERGGNAVLAINPHLLVFVEGIQQYPDPTWPGGVESYWWGGVLTPAQQYPVTLSVPHQLVYSPHEYGPLKWQMPFFGPHMTYQSLSAVWEKHWGFLEKPGFPQQAPIFIGEFGTCGDTARCVDDSQPGSQGLWFSYLMRYLLRHPEIGWSYWALNGTNHKGDPTPKYILQPDWKTVQLHALVDTLRDLEVPAPPPTG